MRLTLLISAVASMVFVACVAGAPATAQVGKRLSAGWSEIARMNAQQCDGSAARSRQVCK